ncbi:MAG TPA: NmrA/HSCARG family protein [Sphingobacterium sp.]|nr:NmrA/HSCARG family protein [Sphingobacterium sp.]
MNSNNNNPILVIGGTGTQGGSVARELLSQGKKVRILSRNPTSEPAKNIAKLGVELVQGDMTLPDTLKTALKDVTAVFSVQYADPADPSVEMNNARNLVNAAQEAGVSQVVHTSAAGTNFFPKWDRFADISWYLDHKYAVEELFRNGGFKYWTVLHPCWFMENFTPPLSGIMSPQLKAGKLYGTVTPNALIKMNSGDDTARLAALAFGNPEKYNGRELNIASDELSWSEVAATLSEVTGKKVTYQQVSREKAVELGMLEGTLKAMEWIGETGYGFDILETAQYGVPLKTFKQWTDENQHRIFVE